MSTDLVAVQRDAVLLDALSQRGRPEAIDDPVVDLLAALVVDVDRGLDDAVTDAPQIIPEQGPRHARPATVVALPLPPVGRRHVARAVAAMVVSAAVLSVGGVAAAVSGDPLTPYKSVINVVRGGYHEVIPHASEVGSEPKAKAAAARAAAAKASAARARAKAAAAEAARAAATTRAADASRASRSAWRGATGQHFWKRHQWDRQLADRHRWNRQMSHGYDRDHHQWSGSSRDGDRRGRAGQGGGRDSGGGHRDSRDYGGGSGGGRR